MAEIRFEHVTKRFGNHVAVNDLNLTVHDRELLTLVGPSGCGKSTTLSMLAGLEDPSSGLITIDGRVVNDVPPGARDIAMVFQSYALYPHMTVRQNIGFGLEVRGVPKREIERRVMEAATILGIQDLLDRRPKELSGGQRQRVALGRALTREPKAFLLDEPLSNLDAQLRMQMRAELKLLFARVQGTVVYVTHDQAEAMTLSDRIAVMNQGVLQQVGTPLEVYNRPKNVFVARFLGSPSMNFIPCEVCRDGGDTYLEGPGLRYSLKGELRALAETAPDRRVILGIRPEDLKVVPKDEHAGLRCQIVLIESMGSQQFIYAQAGNGRIIVTTEPDFQATVGDDIQLALDDRKLHLFDRATEQNLLFMAAGSSVA